MKKAALLFVAIVMSAVFAGGQTQFRSGIFLHHSTGGCIWGPNGSSTSVPQQMALYNTAHGYTGPDAVTMTETWYPAWNDNEWVTWHSIFETNSPENISTIMSANRIVMIKSCFPASSMWGVGTPGDTVNPDWKTIENYKWHWRHIVNVMKAHPENFFVIWTNAPLEWYSTDSTEAANSDAFCYWAKDTLAEGLDPVYGSFPANVYVFDFFHKLVDPYGFLPQYYAAGPGDSHPNAAATALVAPQLVNEIFDAAIAYESGFQVDLQVILQGPFIGSIMETSLYKSGFLPLSQPYAGPPWNYPGTESVTLIPNANVVDWVLVELRDAPSAAQATVATRIARQAGFLLKDGTIKGTDGSSNLSFNASISNHLFVVICHRNHLAVMSANALVNAGGTYSWDFTYASSQAYGGTLAQKQLATGIWGMFAGDGTSNGNIDNADKNDIWKPQAGMSGYRAGDFNLSGIVDNVDKNALWNPNSGRSSQVP